RRSPRHRLGRDHRLLAGALDSAAGRLRRPARRVRAVPLLRRGQAAAGRLHRSAALGGHRHSRRRPGGRRAHALRDRPVEVLDLSDAISPRAAPPGQEHELVSLAGALGERLRANNLLAVTAESCTGGMIAAAITEIAGSSAWFERGFVSYSNESKQDLLR